MVFSSVIFLFLFLPIVLGGYYLLPGREAKKLWLVAASLLFYAFSGLWYVLLLLFSVFCNYIWPVCSSPGERACSMPLWPLIWESWVFSSI